MQTLQFLKNKIIAKEHIPYTVNYFALLSHKVKVISNFPHPYTFSDVEKLIALKEDFDVLALLVPADTDEEKINLLTALYPVDYIFLTNTDDFQNYTEQGLSLINF